MKPFKWAYDLKDDNLDVWPVSGPQSWASPQHGDRLTNEQYGKFYQGRIVMGANGVEDFTFYPDRPYVGRTPEGAEKALEAIKGWSTDFDYYAVG